MKKLFFCMLAMFAFASCSHDDDMDQINGPKMVDVTFNVKTFDVSDEPMTRAASAAVDALDKINYFIEGTTSSFQMEGTQFNDTKTKSFGKITLRLPEGSFNVFFWGAGKNNATGTASFIYYSKGDPFDSGNYISINNKDVFYVPKEVKTFSNGTMTVDYVMQRATAKLTVRLTDKIPADVDHVDVRIMHRKEWRPFTKDPLVQYGSEWAYEEATLTTKSDGSFEDFVYFVYPHEDTSVKFTLKDAKSLSLGSMVVATPTYINRNTIVRGNLFDLIAGKDFNVTVNEEWGEDNIVEMQ